MKALGVHFGISLLIAALVAVLVFVFWFPYPYRTLAGGQHLFWLIVGIDVVCGPLLTAVLFNPTKSPRELTLDLSIVGVLQIAALLYGVHALALARPVRLAYEVDRFVVVSEAQIDQEVLGRVSSEFQTLPWDGPVLVGTRAPRDSDETLRSIDLSAQGMEPSARPDWWQSYDRSRPQVLKRMKAAVDLRAQLKTHQQDALDRAIKETGLPISQISYLPLVSRDRLDDWVVLLDKNAAVIGYASVDGFGQAAR